MTVLISVSKLLTTQNASCQYSSWGLGDRSKLWNDLLGEVESVEIVRILGIALVAVFLLLILRQLRPEFALLGALVAGLLIFLLIVDKIQGVLGLLQELADQAGISSLYLHTILKVIGIAYLTEFASQVAKDANEGAIAAKVELAGKIIIIFLALPIIRAILDTVVKLMP